MPHEGAEVVVVVEDGGRIGDIEVVDVASAEAALGTAIEVDTDLPIDLHLGLFQISYCLYACWRVR
jgi:hypothetical protein